MSAVLVIAKEPRPGFSKTRLIPDLGPDGAAAVAEAALADTLECVAATPADRRILVLDGRPGQWLPVGMEVVAQANRPFDRRLAAAFDAVEEPCLLIGMDTPQVTPDLLAAGLGALVDADAVLGPASDGGWWALGIRRPDGDAVRGVPMSTTWTGAAQAQRLTALGLTYARLPVLRDVDTIDDARDVAGLVPGSRFARTLHAIVERHPAERRGDGPEPAAVHR